MEIETFLVARYGLLDVSLKLASSAWSKVASDGPPSCLGTGSWDKTRMSYTPRVLQLMQTYAFGEALNIWQDFPDRQMGHRHPDTSPRIRQACHGVQHDADIDRATLSWHWTMSCEYITTLSDVIGIRQSMHHKDMHVMQSPWKSLPYFVAQTRDDLPLVALCSSERQLALL